DLLEQAGHEVSRTIVDRTMREEPDGPLAARLVEHLATMGNRAALLEFVDGPQVELAVKALLALAELHPAESVAAARKILANEQGPEPLRALAAGLLAEREEKAAETALL